jgi:hypothetical protein
MKSAATTKTRAFMVGRLPVVRTRVPTLPATVNPT